LRVRNTSRGALIPRVAKKICPVGGRRELRESLHADVVRRLELFLGKRR